MPACGHLTAPKFDPTQPCKLCRYFDELDMLFTACSITNSDQMKRHACCYLDIDSTELWESVPEFTTGVLFNNFRTAIHKLYPSSKNNCKWSISDMDKLVSEQLHVRIFDASNLGMYYRLFYNITQFLHTKNRILEAEQSRAFVQGFQPSLRSLHSPTFPSGLQSDSDRTLGLHSDSDRTSPPAKGLQISSPSPSPVHWSPSGIRVVLGIPRTSRSESTGSTRTHWLFIYLHISKLKIKCSRQVSNPRH
jgi:hypothetical protein